MARRLQWDQRLRADIETVQGESFDGLSEDEIVDRLEDYCDAGAALERVNAQSRAAKNASLAVVKPPN